ncbi:MAG: hypothetical protein D3907_01850 [Candidatus Electrothrix sp. AUS3]|nr:hypothetical protein [Candidatus Electrothrix gigas]
MGEKKFNLLPVFSDDLTLSFHKSKHSGLLFKSAWLTYGFFFVAVHNLKNLITTDILKEGRHE